MSRARFALLLAVVPAALAAQTSDTTSSPWPPLKVVDIRWMDTTVSACTDFNQFANGGWLAHDTIPAAYASSGVTRDMSDRNELVVRSVLEDAAAHRNALPPRGTPRKLGTFYATCMDSTAIETGGATPIRRWLRGLDSVTTRARLLPEIAKLQILGVNVVFRYSPDVDPHDAARYLTWLYQGGLGLPDRDYYFTPGAAADSTRDAYVAHVAKYFRLAGRDSAGAGRAATQVLALETSLAQASLTRVERRDPAKTDHPMSAAQLAKLTPGIAWPRYFRSLGVRVPITKANVAEPAFVQRVDSLLHAAPLATWRAYLTYHAIATAAPWLSTPFVQEDFAFRSRFSGARALLPRWKRCLQEADGDIGEALGQAYVAKTFPPEARARARAVIDDIRAAFRERLLHLTWMSDSTRAQALDKLARMGEKIGYPDRWRDYSRLRVAEGPFVLNVSQANAFEWERTANRPGSPVDTTEWGITVPTVNAYYDPSKNEMVFPAGALVPQTFDPNADDGANYGSLGGSWAGHELTHGFDDEGRHYDAKGNLRDWWQPSDSMHFVEQAALVEQQFDSYIQIDTFHVNGKLTEGENIADWGGLLTGYDALQRALTRDGRPGLIEGYTPEQRYFIGYAQSWRVHNRPERLRTRVTVDPHAPEQWRVNGPLSNIAAFAQAFGCKDGDPMVRPKDKIPSIW
ncbi:MAG TPA: M13 family metallopeptidase [Gemmatimonadales bacterium]|jgi:putative endopeptidase|nr:M13 family metallopeptidase [Gemmatimonadales bacterium]